MKKGPARGGADVAILIDLLSLGGNDVGRAQALLAALGSERHFLTFRQGFETVALNGGVMDEDIRAAVSRADKSKTFTIVKPFDDTCVHAYYLICVIEQCDSRQLVTEKFREGLLKHCERCYRND
jgi:hypothetical protein